MRIKTGVLAVCVTAATFAAPSAAAAPPPAATYDTSLTPADMNAGDVALAVETRPAFAGIRVTPAHDLVEVYVTRTDPDLEAAALAAARGVPVRFTRVKHSYTTLRALQRRILADLHAGVPQAAGVVGMPLKDSLNRVVVEVTGLTTAKESALLARYGSDRVVVRPGVAHGDAYAASRLNDFAQWNGGSMVYASNGLGTCTGGPGVKDSLGKEYLLLAGHCFRTSGTSGWDYPLYQGSLNSTADDPVRIGTAKARYPVSYGADLDIALSTLWDGGSGLDFVTTTPTATSPYSRPQKGALRSVEGTPVCMSGAYTGERCGAVVDAYDDPYPGFGPGGLATVTHLNRAGHPFSPIAGPGDSGGPVYQSRADGLWVSGYINAPGGNHNQACPNATFYNRGNTCDSLILFTAIHNALDHMNVTLILR